MENLPHRVTCPMMTTMCAWNIELERRIRERTARVVASGMGSVGLSCLGEAARAGLSVRGIELELRLDRGDSCLGHGTL